MYRSRIRAAGRRHCTDRREEGVRPPSSRKPRVRLSYPIRERQSCRDHDVIALDFDIIETKPHRRLRVILNSRKPIDQRELEAMPWTPQRLAMPAIFQRVHGFAFGAARNTTMLQLSSLMRAPSADRPDFPGRQL